MQFGGSWPDGLIISLAECDDTTGWTEFSQIHDRLVAREAVLIGQAQFAEPARFVLVYELNPANATRLTW